MWLKGKLVDKFNQKTSETKQSQTNNGLLMYYLVIANVFSSQIEASMKPYSMAAWSTKRCQYFPA